MVHAVTSVRADGTKSCFHIGISESAPWKITLLDGEVLGSIPRGFEFFGDDLFEALKSLRRELEKLRWQLLCAGSRLDVFPSAMSRDMSAGRKAYVMRLGFPATEIVDIFDYAVPESIATVAQQAEFHARWIKSIR